MRWLESRLFIPIALAAMTLAIFWKVLVLPGDQLFSRLDGDVGDFFIYWRQFGFDQLRAGHIALWNPHVFCGVPFLGGSQTGLLYPPNWILYLILPLAKAIDWEFALHVFLLGFFMALWAGHYRLHPLAILLGSSVAMFGGSFFPRLSAGQLGPSDTMVWVPLILLAVDGALEEPNLKWVLLGIFALAMHVLADYPPLVFNTVITCALYAGIRLIKAPRPIATVIAFAIVGAGALLITGTLVWTELQAASEAVRRGGVPFRFASSFSLTPENLMTFLTPGLFGDITNYPYWGRWNLWEVCPFFGVTGLTMAVFALKSNSRHERVWAATAVLLLLIALGNHTPIFTLLYRYVPGFSSFRSPSKFEFGAGLFLAMLAGVGADNLLKSTRPARIAPAVLLTGALIVGLLGACLWSGISAGINGAWSDLVRAMAATVESDKLTHWLKLPDARFVEKAGRFAAGTGGRPKLYLLDTRFVEEAGRFAGHQCVIAATVLLILGALFLLSASRRAAAYALVLFGIAEMFAFAHSTVSTFSLASKVPTGVHHFLDAHPGDYRITGIGNGAIAIGAREIWGYDPTMLDRYNRYFGYSQSGKSDEFSLDVKFHDLNFKSPLMHLIGLRFAFLQLADRYRLMKIDGGLPHLRLAGDWLRIAERDRILATLNSPSFDPLKTVILESDPIPAPASGEPQGTTSLVEAGSGSMTITADVVHPALLVIADAYSRYWRAVPLSGSSQSQYQVLPADYALMAVPLSAGHHAIRLEYAPSGWVVGRWISLGALALYLCAAGWFLATRKVRNPARTVP